MQIEFNNGQDVHEDPSSNIQSLVLSTPEHNKEEESEIGGETNSKTKAKRTRKPLQLQKRLEIITFWEANQNMSMVEISKKFKLARTTVYGIISSRGTLKKLIRDQSRAGLTLERYSTAGSRFHILEELLIEWFLELGSRGVSVTDKKITAQASELHRMLSGLVVEPLPPCAFTSGWLKRFKDRRKTSFEAAKNICNSMIQDESRLFVEEHLRHFSGSLDDIYMCDCKSVSHSIKMNDQVFSHSLQSIAQDEGNDDAPAMDVGDSTFSADIFLDLNHIPFFPTPLDSLLDGNANMYLDMHPSEVHDGSSQESSESKMQYLEATVLLCCNASGSDKRPPVIF
ncbi:hypothetical protein BGZ65_008899, partial [Modicella reniformis]